MNKYFCYDESIQYKLENNVYSTIEKIANMFIGKNPALPTTFKCFSKEGFRQTEDGRYDLNLGQKHPNAKMGQYSYAFGMLWSDSKRNVDTNLSCYGPTKIYVNGSLIFTSTVIEDVNVNNRKVLNIALKEGWNAFLICIRKVSSGFGCIFGSNRSCISPMDFMTPFSERSGYSGWIYSEAVDSEVFNNGNIPGYDSLELDSSQKWFPILSWDSEKAKLMPCARVFGVKPLKYAYGWSSLYSYVQGKHLCILKGVSSGQLTLWVDGQKILSKHEAGPFKTEINIGYGKHDVLVLTVSGESDWGFSLHASMAGRTTTFRQSCPVKGIGDPWLYLGPFNEEQLQEPENIQTMYQLYSGSEGSIYWKVDCQDTWVRAYIENPMFGKWSYPLGVTLYGLLQTGRVLKRQDIIDYVARHFYECTRLYHYAVWDGEQFGYPSVMQKMVELKMLDDCGSMGSAMLECYGENQDVSFLDIADIIADHMANKQERRDDGAFYRICKGYFMENTLWADDLYMSVPFLARYYRMTGNRGYIDDAAKQFLLFKKYLFLSEYKIMSHVYDFKYDTNTQIPWGRGNGWCLFSLSELLETLPTDHIDRPKLLHFFNELCEGYLALQGVNGLWHQVLTDFDSYEETSCTAMFTYGFCRGIRFGWLENNGMFIKAVYKAWNGLTAKCIDREGNIHGVCKGSRYSFTPEYYKNELLWTTNDAHGIGIVMLAGIEASKLEEWLKNDQADES